MTDIGIDAKRKSQQRQRLMEILVVSVLLLAAAALVVLIVGDRIEKLQKNQITAVQKIVLEARKDELQHFVQVGRRMMAHYCSSGNGPIRLSKEGKELLRGMDLDKTSDNYFFVYTMNGISVMHPRLPQFEGTDLWSANEDHSFYYVVQKLLDRVRSQSAGDRYFEYLFPRPSTKRIESKLGYVEYSPECDLMIGTGLYLDNMIEVKAAIEKQTEETRRSTRNWIVVVALVSLLIVAAGGLTRNLHEQRLANEKLRRMARQVSDAEEEERTRVSMELHDGVSQSLVAAKFSFETAYRQLVKDNLEKSKQTLSRGIEELREGMREVRELSHRMRSAMLDDQGLGSAIEQEGREFGERTGIGVVVEVNNIPSLQKHVQNDLYRTFQEATRNVEKHAQARHVTVHIESSKAGLWMRIGDDGVGTPGGTRTAGIGLLNMRERIERHHGHFEFQSRPGLTQVTVFVPCAHL